MPSIHQIFTFHHFDREIIQLYSSHAIRSFTLALIYIFEPIYLFIYFNHSFSKTLLFYAAISLIYGLFVPFGAKIMAKLGLKKAMLWSVPFIFLYYLTLWQINVFFLLLFLAIILKVIYALFYWPAYHTDVARFSQRKTRGEQMSVATVVYSVASVAAPLLGGLIIFKFGFPVLFIIVLILLFVSVVPLLFSKEIHEVYTDSYKRAFKQILSKKARRDSIAFGAFGFDTGVSMFIWPIFMFILVINYELIGIITSGALFLSLLFALYIGELADVKRKKLLRIGSVITAIAWFLKTFVTTPFNAFLAHAAYRFAAVSSGIPFRAIMYDKASEDGKVLDRYIVFREMAHNLGRAIMFIALAIVFFFVPITKIYLVFPLAGVFALLFMLLAEKEKPLNDARGKEIYEKK